MKKLVIAAFAVTMALLSNDAIAQRGCAAGQPCFDEAHEVGKDLVFTWTNDERSSHFNIRVSRPGREWPQVEIGGSARTFTLTSFSPNTRYSFSIQSCNRSWTGSSTCSAWEKVAYTSCGAPDRPCGRPPLKELSNGAGRCLDLDAGNMYRNGASVGIWKCNNTHQQLWSLYQGTVRSYSGKCLEVFAPDLRKEGARIQAWDCNGLPQQRWTRRGLALVNAAGKCLNAPTPNNEGSLVTSAACDGSQRQRWTAPLTL